MSGERRERLSFAAQHTCFRIKGPPESAALVLLQTETYTNFAQNIYFKPFLKVRDSLRLNTDIAT